MFRRNWRQIHSRQKNVNDSSSMEATQVPGLITRLYKDNKEGFDELHDVAQRELLLKKLLKPYCIGIKHEAKLFRQNFLFQTFYRQKTDTKGRNLGEVQNWLQKVILHEFWLKALQDNEPRLNHRGCYFNTKDWQMKFEIFFFKQCL